MCARAGSRLSHPRCDDDLPSEMELSQKLSAIIPAISADGRLYKIEKLAAHQQGVLHPAISVFVFDGERLLIQRRAAGKYHCAGLWANTCCSHPHWGESMEDAAARRMIEELGCSAPLAAIGETEYRADVGDGLIEHERVSLFRGKARADTIQMRLNPEEVAQTRWVTIPDLKAQVGARPEHFAPWLRIYLDRWNTLGLG